MKNKSITIKGFRQELAITYQKKSRKLFFESSPDGGDIGFNVDCVRRNHVLSAKKCNIKVMHSLFSEISYQITDISYFM